MTVGLVALLIIAGLLSGFMDGVLGLGGGLVLIAALSWQLPPQDVVVATAPVLLASSIARTLVFRTAVDRAVVAWQSVGAIPSVVLGGLLLSRIPTRALEVLMGVFLVAYALADALPRVERPTRGPLAPRAFLGVGAATGFVAATVGGAGPLIVPFLRRRGLTRTGFIGTMAGMASATLTLKTAVYAATGLLRVELLTVAIILGASALVATWAARRVAIGMRTDAHRRLLDLVVLAGGLRLLVG